MIDLQLYFYFLFFSVPETAKSLVSSVGVTDRDRLGQTGTRRDRRDRQGQTGTDRDRQGQTGTDRDGQGQMGTDRDRWGQTGTGRDRKGLSLLVSEKSEIKQNKASK